MPFPHEAILGSDFFSALVDAFLYHEWPSATRDREMHQLVLRKSQTLELPHVEKIQLHLDAIPPNSLPVKGSFQILNKFDLIRTILIPFEQV